MSIETFQLSPSMIHGTFMEDNTPCVCGHPKHDHPFQMKCRKGDCKKFQEDVNAQPITEEE